MLQAYELRRVVSQPDWEAYHRIRRAVLFEARGRFDYNDGLPDERDPNNQPLLLLFKGNCIGTVRLDYVAPDIGIIRLFAIGQRFQRLGHGSNFLLLLAQYAAALGITILEANAAREAVAFWQRKGFELIDGGREFPLLRRSAVNSA